MTATTMESPNVGELEAGIIKALKTVYDLRPERGFGRRSRRYSNDADCARLSGRGRHAGMGGECGSQRSRH